MKRKYFFIGLTVLFIGFILIGCRNTVNAEGYVAIDINPSVEFIINRNDKVIKVNALNDDGEVLIANENFIGMDIALASEKVVTLAVELGFLDVDAQENNPDAVMVTTLHYSSRAANRLRLKVYDRLDKYFMNNGIWAVILTDESMDNIAQEAKDLGIPAGKLRLIKSIQTVDPSFDTNEGAKMSIQGLMNIVKDKKPFAVKVQELQSRIDEINSQLSTLDSINDSALIATLTQELNDINNQLNKIELIKEKVQNDKAQLRERLKEKVANWRQNRQNRKETWQQFKNSLTEEEKQMLRQYFLNKVYNR